MLPPPKEIHCCHFGVYTLVIFLCKLFFFETNDIIMSMSYIVSNFHLIYCEHFPVIFYSPQPHFKWVSSIPQCV